MLEGQRKGEIVRAPDEFRERAFFGASVWDAGRAIPPSDISPRK